MTFENEMGFRTASDNPVARCADCEFSQWTKNSQSTPYQCHLAFDTDSNKKIFQNKTRAYRKADDNCRNFELCFPWWECKVEMKEGVKTELLDVAYSTQTFVYVKVDGKTYELRKEQLSEGKTIKKHRPRRDFRLISPDSPHDHIEAKSDSTPSLDFTQKEDGDKHTQQTLAQVASDEPTTFGSHACYSLMQYEKYMSEEQDIAFEVSGYKERDAWAFDHAAYDTWIRMSILSLHHSLMQGLYETSLIRSTSQLQRISLGVWKGESINV